MIFEWEIVSMKTEIDQNLVTSRAEIFGGWLVRQNWWLMDGDLSESICCALTFVPDPQHEWGIDVMAGVI